MKRSDILPVYKTIVQMRELAERLDKSLEKEDFSQASEVKIKILELQRSLKKLI